MRILTVVPIARAIAKDTLTYFTKEDILPGSIVSIPLRKKHAYGLVLESKRAEEMKSEIKTLAYNIRKIEKLKAFSFLSPNFIESCTRIADYYACSVGAVLAQLVPSKVLEASKELAVVGDVTHEKILSAKVACETLVLQTEDIERYATYRSLIREEFARGRSIFFCLPTTEDVRNAGYTLEKGIESYTFTLHAGLTPKDMTDIWKEILREPHPVLVVSTGSFLSLPREDIATVILEKESSRAYKMQSRPYLDIRTVAEIFCKTSGKRLVLGDTLLRIETLWEAKNNAYAELAPLKFRSLSSAQCEIVNMRKPADMEKKSDKKEFALFSDNLKKMLTQAKEDNEKVFLFASRKGLFPSTVCNDCGTVVVCTNCAAPVVLYKSTSKNLFVCHHCGERRDAHELCIHCKGWRLTPLGIGTDGVFEEILSLFPSTVPIILDKEHIKTHKQAVKARDTFYNTPGSVMIGTEMALPYLSEKIENMAVVSLDSFFSIPDFRIHEKIFHILLTMRTLTEKEMIVQTRQKDTKLFDYALRGNLVDFYRDEIEERKAVDYPPFVTYIKLTLEGTKAAVKKRMEEIQEVLMPYTLSVFDAFTPGSAGKFTVHGLIALEKGSWPDPVLTEKLRSLGPEVSVKVDPDTLL